VSTNTTQNTNITNVTNRVTTIEGNIGAGFNGNGGTVRDAIDGINNKIGGSFDATNTVNKAISELDGKVEGYHTLTDQSVAAGNRAWS